ncbi:hypothetical protein IIA79_07330 [bacterium]|nr:hypothetical protein [bacterium]
MTDAKRRGYPAIIHYSYGYPGYGYNPAYPAPLYTAPPLPQYGYYGPAAGAYYIGGQPVSPGNPVSQAGGPYGTQLPQPQEISIHNDNSTIYNYYGNEFQPIDQPAAATPKAPISPAQHAPEAADGMRAYGVRFYEQTRLETPEGAYEFTMDGSSLLAGPETGPGLEISSRADPSFGVFAFYMPGSGVSIIFAEAGGIVAAYPTEGGEWWIEPLPYEVDFGKGASIGMVGGRPWVTFSGKDDSRYVFAFSGRRWQEIGSAYVP